MSWYHSWGIFETAVVASFIILYATYVFRIIRLSKILRADFASVIFKILLRGGYFTLLILALLGPSFGSSRSEVKSIGKDIMIDVDLSESMNANDIQPSRIEKVKFELRKIIDEFSSDRIGLIIFSSEAFMQCPLTFDQEALNLFIETLNTSLVPNTGTDFGPALTMSLDKLGTDEESTVDPKSKIILLISDGEDFGNETANVRSEVKDRGIKLFTLGVGTTRGSKIPTPQGFKKDRAGKDVISKLGRQSLKELAARTGGKYFEISNHQNDVSRLINSINDVKGQLRDARTIDVSANKYVYFLSAAFVLMLLDSLLFVKPLKI